LPAGRHLIEQLLTLSPAMVTVRDHGAGAPESSLAYLFRPFCRVADARDCKTGGIGRGLAITERAVRLHGGTGKASNAPGARLIVEMKLPARPSPESDSFTQPDHLRRAAAGPPTKK